MMNGVIVIKEFRKQYKTAENQSLLSLVPLSMEQTHFNKVNLFFSVVFYLPFNALLKFFLSIFTVTMQKHPL